MVTKNQKRQYAACGALVACVLAVIIAFFAGKFSNRPADDDDDNVKSSPAEIQATKDTAIAIDDAEKAAQAAEQAAVSARKAADSTKETAESAENSAADTAESAKAAQNFVNKVNK